MKFAILAALSTALLSGSAFAADLIIPAPEEAYLPEVSTWSGFYIGANLGYGTAGLYLVEDDEDGTDLEGFLGGVQAGYNVQMDSIVFGVEGDVALGDVSVGFDEDDNDFGYDIDVEYLATLRGRLGFAVESLLFYGTAGVAFSSVNVSDGDDEFSMDHIGWVAGVGAEMMVTDSVSVKAEYLYHDLGDEVYDFDDDAIELDVSTFKIGANFHF